jgi:hypothetical protein
VREGMAAALRSLPLWRSQQPASSQPGEPERERFGEAAAKAASPHCTHPESRTLRHTRALYSPSFLYF